MNLKKIFLILTHKKPQKNLGKTQTLYWKTKGCFEQKTYQKICENFISLHILAKISKRTDCVRWKRFRSCSQSAFTCFPQKSIVLMPLHTSQRENTTSQSLRRGHHQLLFLFTFIFKLLQRENVSWLARPKCKHKIKQPSSTQYVTSPRRLTTPSLTVLKNGGHIFFKNFIYEPRYRQKGTNNGYSRN